MDRNIHNSKWLDVIETDDVTYDDGDNLIVRRLSNVIFSSSADFYEGPDTGRIEDTETIRHEILYNIETDEIVFNRFINLKIGKILDKVPTDFEISMLVNNILFFIEEVE